MTKRIYLAGPIAGKTYEEANEWRNIAGAYLSQFDIEAYSPMRGTEFLRGERITVDTYDNVVATDKGIVARDRYDVKNCDLLLVNFTDAEYCSVGTPVELGWADAYRKPIIVIMPDDTNPYYHPFTRELADYVVEDLQDALEIAVSILIPEKFDAH